MYRFGKAISGPHEIIAVISALSQFEALMALEGSALVRPQWVFRKHKGLR